MTAWLAAALAGGVTVSGEIPANTWVRLADCPGDAEGREVPPGRAATWCYVPPLKAFVRYGGYTPRFSNAMDKFDPATKKWTRLAAEDENYPPDRPGGSCRTALCWDPARKLLLIGGGLANGYTGVRGLWSWNPKTGKFAALVKNMPRGISMGCFDPKAGLYVTQPWPKSSGLGREITMVFSMAQKKWVKKRHKLTPQPQWSRNWFPMVYHGKLGKILLVSWENKKHGPTTWAFDGAGMKWEKLEVKKHPPARAVTTVAYDPVHAVVLMHGGSDGKLVQNGTREDSWILDLEKKEWREIKAPGPPPMKRNKKCNEILYRQALDYDTDRKQFLLSDPDIGAWAFRYDPEASPGKAAVTGGFTARVCAAAANKPSRMPSDPKEREKLEEKRVKFPTALNKRIVDMPDNSVIRLGGGALPGNEVGWCYDSDAGVFVRYGGCGNHSNPFWKGYGNSLVVYDPGAERVYTRRVGDISGAKRPATGCTRSVMYDSGRKLTWIFGCASSGPYCPGCIRNGAYDIKGDVFLALYRKGRAPVKVGCVLQYSPDHKTAIVPDKGKTWHFDPKAATWSARPTPNSPGHIGGYQRMAYVKSKKVFLVIGFKGPTPRKGEKDTRLNTMHTYDPAAGKWTDLEARNQPPFRTSKFGFTYDSRNDVAVLVGGNVRYNTGARNDLWVYHVKKNAWEQMKPKPAGGLKKLPTYAFCLATGYDPRHNAVIFCCHNRPYAYRYKK
jgi:hypothetical protein